MNEIQKHNFLRKKFWTKVYLNQIDQGKISSTAMIHAETALKHFDEQFPKPTLS